MNGRIWPQRAVYVVWSPDGQDCLYVGGTETHLGNRLNYHAWRGWLTPAHVVDFCEVDERDSVWAVEADLIEALHPERNRVTVDVRRLDKAVSA